LSLHGGPVDTDAIGDGAEVQFRAVGVEADLAASNCGQPFEKAAPFLHSSDFYGFSPLQSTSLKESLSKVPAGKDRNVPTAIRSLAPHVGCWESMRTQNVTDWVDEKKAAPPSAAGPN
jgi:hypothetical protein